MIKGGYILQPRKIDESEVFKMPPVTRELWMYILRKVNHKDNGQLKRGQGFFRLSNVQKDLEWYVGYRVERYSKPQLTKSLRRLREGNMVETMKATHGILVTVCNYEYYQASENYEGNDEGTTKAPRRKRRGSNIDKNGKNERNNYIDIHQFYKDEVEAAKKYVEKFPEAKNDMEEYKKFVLFLYDWKNKNNKDPNGKPLQKPLTTVLSLKEQFKFIEFVKLLKKAKEYNVDIYEKVLGMENRPDTMKKRKSFYLTLNDWLKPFDKK
jgi:hypothetical protein